MAEESSQQQEPQGEPKGGPDLTEANKRLTGENAQLKEQLQAMQKQRDELDAKLGKALTQEDVAATVKAANDEAKKAYEGEKAKWAASNKRLAVQGSLAQAGCIDAAALMAHVDMESVDIAPDGHIRLASLAESRHTSPRAGRLRPVVARPCARVGSDREKCSRFRERLAQMSRNAVDCPSEMGGRIRIRQNGNAECLVRQLRKKSRPHGFPIDDRISVDFSQREAKSTAFLSISASRRRRANLDRVPGTSRHGQHRTCTSMTSRQRHAGSPRPRQAPHPPRKFPSHT